MAWQGEVFKGKIGFTMEDSEPAWDLPPRPPAGTPNVLWIVLDDVGYGNLGCYGSPIETPAMDGIARRGLLYSNMHTTAMCSPTRACLLTGRNPHTCGMGLISELASGFPGYDGIPKPSRAYISELLQARGFSTYAVGKWHQVPAEEMTMAGPFDRWPLGRGFDRFYGFLGGETHQFYPDLVYDNHFVHAPATPEEGYILGDDLADKAISFLRDLRSADQDKPFFMYYCTSGVHSPHQAPQEWIDRYKGRFDAGWDVYREETHRRQLEMGIIPPGTELSPRPDWVKAWDSLSADEKRLYSRMMEVFAGFLSHTDATIGRVIDALDDLGDLDNTVIMLISDNGASGEGGFFGSFNENLVFNGVPDTLEQNLVHYDALGGPHSFGHYPTGWTMAGNTPFKRWKRNVFNGGIADPFLVSWPEGIAARGEVRGQYAHAIDVTATTLDILGLEVPDMFEGIPQETMAGVSFRGSFASTDAAESRTMQYYELYGSRALYKDGYKAVTFHAIPGLPADGPGDPTAPYDDDVWELYDTKKDFSECHDLAAQEPRRLQQLKNLWFAEAGKYDIFPLHSAQRKGQRPKPGSDRTGFVYWPNTTPVDNEAAVNLRMRPFNVVVRATIPAGGAEGVLIAQGGEFAGWTLFIKDGRLIYEHNYLGLERYRVVSTEPVPEGFQHLGLGFEITGQFEITPALTAQGVQGVSGQATLYFGDKLVGNGEIARTVPFGWTLSGEGLCCGFDSETPVSDLYEAPFEFTGDIDRAIVTVGGKPFEVMVHAVAQAFLAE
jgi:arylsulfatase A-like enzyme